MTSSRFVCQKAKVRFVTEVPEDAPLWLRLHQVADKHLASFERAYREYVGRLKGQLPLEDLERALDVRDPLAMTALLSRLKVVSLAKADLPPGVPEDPLEGLTAQYRSVLLEAAKTAYALEPAVLQNLPYLDTSFTLTNPRAVQYARTMSSTLITSVDDATISSVQQIVARGLDSRTALAPPQMAKLIQEVVGLTPRQADTVARYRRGLKGTEASIDKRTARFAARQHRQRGLTIARTETMRSANMGVRLLGEELTRVPFVRSTDIAFVWITTPDDRLCARCAGMHDQVVGYQQQFQEGPTSKRPVSTATPPLHPRCRCAIARKVQSVEELEARAAAYAPTSGLTRAQLDALAPAKRYNQKLREKTMDALFETHDGEVLSDLLYEFQQEEALSGLRAGITKELMSPGTGGERARVLLAAMRGADPVEDVLWRGMRVSTSQKQLLSKYTAGETIDLNLSSFSMSPGVARTFAEGAGQASGTKVIIGVSGTKNGALPIQNLAASSSVFSEKELIMGGKFRVVGSEKQGDTIVIHLKQLAAL